jgi:hypothetical protein
MVGILMAAAASGLGVVLFAPLFTFRDKPSPDGTFVAVVRTRMIDAFVPGMPGQASDRPGRMTLYRKDGRSCGSVALVMASFAYDLTWDLDATPRTARIGPIATWNLDACAASVSGL